MLDGPAAKELGHLLRDLDHFLASSGFGEVELERDVRPPGGRSGAGQTHLVDCSPPVFGLAFEVAQVLIEQDIGKEGLESLTNGRFVSRTRRWMSG